MCFYYQLRVSISLCVLLVILLSHLLLVHKIQTCVETHEHIHKPLGEKWPQQKPGKGPSLPSQAPCVWVIARGIGSPLKQLRACVHVLKRQCYVSACHLEALAPRFFHALTFLFLCPSGIKVLLRGSLAKAWLDPLLHRGRLISQ